MKLFRNQSGQGMTEYIIIVAVIAVAAIAAFTYFGKTVRNQTAGMAEAMSGDETAAQTAVTAAGTAAEAAATDAATEKNLSNYVEGSGKK